MLNFTFIIVTTLVNDILLVLSNITIDIVLLKNFHTILNNKARHLVDDEQHMNIQKSRKNVNRMIFVNSLLYIVSHLPESLTTLLLIMYSKKIVNFCQFNFSCDLLNEEAAFFSLLSMMGQFYVFRIFDKNFRASYQDSKARLLAICCFCCSYNTNSDASANNNKNSANSTQSVELKNLNNLIGNGLID